MNLVKNGILNENPTFVQVVGMCPVLATTTSAVNGVGMGISTTLVLICSNLFISLIRNFVPNQIRIPVYVVVISAFVTIIEFLMKAYTPVIYNSLGLFIPLIVVNCLLLARAEAYAAKHTPIKSVLDGMGMGLGFTLALILIGVIREFIGNGTVLTGTAFELTMPETFPRTLLMILPPGAFITLGSIMAYINHKTRLLE